MKRLWIAALLLAACRGGGGSGAPAVTVTITAPADGDTITGVSVPVTLAATGIEIAPASEERPGTAHHHLFFDVDLTLPGDTIPAGVAGIRHLGRGQTEFQWDSVPPGPHRIIAMLADPWHVPLAPLAVDTINVVVKP
jgi:uncharacterized protein DUF4399